MLVVGSFLLNSLLFCVTLRFASALHSPEEIAERLAARGDDPYPESSRGRRQLPTEISIQVTAPLFSSRLFDYGPDHGDGELPQSLDVGKQVQLSHPLVLLGEEFSTVYVLSNGGIGFDAASRSYKANLFPKGHKLIAPFWNRNDMRNGGHVYYREITSGRILERGQSEIRYQYDKNVKVESCLLVTWQNMQPLGDQVLPAENTNTFQAAIFITDNGTFANFIYNNIGWTQGAEAGFNNGDGVKHYALPTSGTGNIMYLEEYGNTGIPGEWMFELGLENIVRCKPGIKGDTCDEQCEASEWGYDCLECCHCADGARCDAATGQCPGECAKCWSGKPMCQHRDETCKVRGEGCAHNAISFTDYDRCGEAVQRCQCLAGYQGDGHVECEDVDECKTESTCHKDAVCTNTPGRFFCQCQEGFSGDGVNECKASFLYPHDKHQTLPKAKNAKVAWQLRYPLKVFGAARERITISSQGIIAMDDVGKLKAGEPLEEQRVRGFAPFFAAIDVLRGGEVSVDETTASDVLTRATQTVTDNYYDPSFVAKSVVTITYINVTNSDNVPGNTFQANIIGGSNSIGDNVTFVHFLYKDLLWSDGAEAVIMSDDAANSVALPGSGTDGITQLTQLSNIKSPGQWLFRVDSETVFPCIQPNLQPPYCENEAAQPPAVPNRPPGGNQPPAPQVQFAGPNKTISTIRVQSPKPVATTAKPRPSFPSISAKLPAARPVSTSFEQEGDSGDPSDEIVATFPPFITVIPQLFTPTLKTNRTNLIVSLSQRPSLTTKPVPPPQLKPAESHEKPTKLIVPPEPIQPKVELPFRQVDGEVTTETVLPEDYEEQPEPAEAADVVSRPPPAPEHGVVAGVSPLAETPPPTFTRIDAQPTPVPEPDSNAVTASQRPIFVFTTPKRVTHPVVPTRAPGTTQRPQHGASPPDNRINSRPFDAGSRQGVNEDSPSSSLLFGRFGSGGANRPFSELAIIIPTAIVGVWLLLLLIIGLVVCCRKRRSRRHIRSMYGPAYQIRQVPAGYGARKGKERSYPAVHGSYEDHLEKAARLSSEMSSYNQNGRVSLYGSYWNLAGSTTASGGQQNANSSRHSPFSYSNQSYYDSCPEFQRYAYNGRY
uniref:Uncharacterized protein n=1 Tax=Plectus sambesii TaxID=2011161 RepID=A0A914UMS4_9BILA